jgi:cation:H+ antiporter
MILNLFVFIIAMLMVIKGATMATKYAAFLAESYRLSKYVVGFVIIAVISILPETLISINAALAGMPSFGLGTLFGSNIADLTLLFTILVIVAGRKLKVEGKILKKNLIYPLLLIVPLILGLDGNFSRIEGVALIFIGAIFYFIALKDSIDNSIPLKNNTERYKHLLKLVFSMGILLLGSHFTVTSATSIANYFGINPILIGMLVVGLGTTMPELFFSLKCVKKKDDSLAIGDLLGTVLADATIVVGILALISPFTFPIKIIYVTGVFMVIASFLLFFFMHTGRNISKKEGLWLFLFWISFVVAEFLANR